MARDAVQAGLENRRLHTHGLTRHNEDPEIPSAFHAAAVSLAFVSTCSFAAGFQQGFAADPDGKPLEIGIWYPSKETPKPMNFGPNTMAVASDGAVDGTELPLVVSHGAGSSFLGHYDTVIALADADYVVAAVTHTGDNYADKTRSMDVMDRPRHISRAIDHMLSAWEGHGSIDATRVGMFGYSAGGSTTLVSIGGAADFSTIGPMCGLLQRGFAHQGCTGGGYGAGIQLRAVQKAGHCDFMAPCSNALASLAPAICKSAPDFDRVAFHRSFNAAAVDFFGKTLNGL